MSVVVRGMEMPENCLKCPMQFGGWCYVSPPEIDERVAPTVDEAVEKGKPDWCPLVEVPEKHGRLIDADALIRFVEDRYEITWESDCYEGGIKDACSDILEKIDTMPTVIEAEGK